jgi:hypothetical protein
MRCGPAAEEGAEVNDIVCEHGHSARVCELCEAQQHIDRLSSELSRLTAENEELRDQLEKAQKDVDFFRNL